MRNFKLTAIIFVSIFLGFFSAISFAQIQAVNSVKSDKTKYQKDFLNKVLEHVKKDYVDDKSEDQIVEAAASGILSSLDPHSSFLNSEDLKEMSVHTKGEFGGVGIEITTDMSVAKVVSAIEDTPAYKADIRSGDYIIRIDGKSTYSMKIDEIVKKIRGKSNTPVKLTIYLKY